MNMPSAITDNVTEILVKIVEFAEQRQKVLLDNINNIHFPSFSPMDLDVEEFSFLMGYAISQHIVNKRLVLWDTNNIKFGAAGSFEVRPTNDERARNLLEENPDAYLEMQVDKLMENSLNLRIAAELLKQKEGIETVFE